MDNQLNLDFEDFEYGTAIDSNEEYVTSGYYRVLGNDVPVCNIHIMHHKEGSTRLYKAKIVNNGDTVIQSEDKPSIYHAVEDLKNKYIKYKEAVDKFFNVTL